MPPDDAAPTPAADSTAPRVGGATAPRVGVALGAGSAAAMAEIGALEVLAESGIPVHCVAGTSAGSIVGAALAAGQLEPFRRSMEGLSRRGVIRLFDLAWPREGLLHGRRALDFVGKHLGESIESLRLPYAAVATDLRSGEEIVLRRGRVFDAVRASIAVPGVFTPWRVDGRLLVDGGLVNPVPVSVARDLGADFVIAVNVLPLREKLLRQNGSGLYEHLASLRADASADSTVGSAGGAADGEADTESVHEELGLVEVVWRASSILASQVASVRLRDDRPGYLLQIPVPAVGMFDLHRTAELVEIGRETARRAVPAIQRALARRASLRGRLAARGRHAFERFVVAARSSLP